MCYFLIVSLAPLKKYRLSTTRSRKGVMGFYQYIGDQMPANKAYLTLPAGTPAPRRIGFGSHTTTGVENTEASIKAEKIVRNGQLYIEREGRIYNAQGAIVK